MKWFILLFLFTQVGLAQERAAPIIDPHADIISDEYEAGAFLIFNCEKKHWVCVLETHYKDCQDKRLEEVKKGGVTHSCAPIGQFPSKKSCFQRVLYMTSHNYGDRFCVKTEWKEKGFD